MVIEMVMLHFTMFQTGSRNILSIEVFLLSQRNWLGGYEKDGQTVKSLDVLKETLSPHFVLLEELDMPFLIRETIREHQWTVAHMSVWMRKI